MKRIFFPGCRIKAGYPQSSEKLKEYMKSVHGLESSGCCKEYYKDLQEGDHAVLICNNCSVELEHLVNDIEVEFVLELIDNDPNFIFPNYQGKVMILQDCYYGYRNHPIDKTVRSLLNKMNISYKEGLDPVLKDMPRADHRALVNANAQKINQEVITYCAICNLAMKNANQHTHYILDLLFGDQ